MPKQICKTCYWDDFIDDDDPDFEPCQDCVYDSGHYNWRPKESQTEVKNDSSSMEKVDK